MGPNKGGQCALENIGMMEHSSARDIFRKAPELQLGNLGQ
jgi:hypothetical protein